ncbi:MAG: molybdate ABC transporter substrate-binding protein [Anaerolineales bacterium]|nr:molybdate ABC transporter substrate-binding protein [Anaerolineales bacterium]
MKTKLLTALFLFALPVLLLGVSVPLAACVPTPTATPAPTGDLTVFAAASLTEAFTELGKQFEAAHPGSTVIFNFAGSNSLAQQIGQAGPADVFASANGAQLLVAIGTGRIVSGTQQTFVRNRLVVIYPNDNPGGVSALPDLAQPGLKVVLAAAEVPVGQYSLDFLDKAAADAAFDPGFKEAVLANVVSYEDNVRAVLTKVALGEADAGIVYSSDVTGDGAAAVTKLDIPDSLNTLANYPIAALNDSPHPALAQAFVELVLSPEGQAVLARYGFIPVK